MHSFKRVFISTFETFVLIIDFSKEESKTFIKSDVSIDVNKLCTSNKINFIEWLHSKHLILSMRFREFITGRIYLG